MPARLTGERLRERRLSLGLKQAEVAAAAGISASYLNLIEHNRRHVGPEVLARLAGVLSVDVRAMAEDFAGGLIEELRAAATALPGITPELERVEEFTGRFPGWAALVAGLFARNAALERAVAALNDRLGHDPHLSAAVHELLSALSGVRSTAAILVETRDLSEDWMERFHKNLHQDSERLAEGAQRLVAYLDRSEAAAGDGVIVPQDEVENWLAARGWQLPELESGAVVAPLQEEVAALGSPAARALACDILAELAADARALPLAPFRAALEELGPDPALLAGRFGASVLAVMRRMAFLPELAAGLVICDTSGTLLFRKPTPGFSLPRFGAACPLWPLFSALMRPGQGVSTRVTTASGEGRHFRALAACESSQPFGFAGPDLRRAAMLILPEPPPADGAAPALAVGSSCRICPKEPCPARREPSIIAPLAQGLRGKDGHRRF